jgi:hypothetical protein
MKIINRNLQITKQIIMKKFFTKLLAIAAIIAMTTVSCQNEKNFDTGINPGTIVEAQFQPVIPASAVSLSSGSGGINNVDAAGYDLRYLLEVWSADGSTLEFRDTVIATIATAYTAPVNFTVQLPAAMYKFVFWADFVTKGSTDDLTYNTGNAGGLKDITWTATAYALSSDLRDAYYAVENVDLTNGDVTDIVTLTRPFGKLRVLATDLYAENVVPATAVVKYTHATTPLFRKSFNAFTGEANSATIDASGDLESTPELEDSVTVKGTAYPYVYLLAFDYFLIPAGLTAVSFDIELFDATSTSLGAAKSISSVPVGVNKLTTIIGAFLPPPAMGEANYTVTIDDNFGNENDYMTTVESVALNKTTLLLNTSKEETLTATVLPANAANKNVTWSSSDAAVATVNNAGKVTAVAPGVATITATSNANDVKIAICTVTVIDPIIVEAEDNQEGVAGVVQSGWCSGNTVLGCATYTQLETSAANLSLSFPVNIPQTAVYTFTFRLANWTLNNVVEVFIDETSVGSAALITPYGLITPDAAIENVSLSSGAHTVKVRFAQNICFEKFIISL